MSANQWFKFFGGEYLSDPKMLTLSSAERSCWVTLLCYASLTDGIVKFLSIDALLFQSGMKPQSPTWFETIDVLEKFEKLGMITLDNDVITILNWKKRQQSSLTSYERLRRHREKKRDETKTITVEEKRIEENRKEKNIGESPPSEKVRDFFKIVSEEKTELDQFISEFCKKTKLSPEYAKSEVKKFYRYWTERTLSGKKERWQLQKTFEISRRLTTWFSNQQKWSNGPNSNKKERTIA